METVMRSDQPIACTLSAAELPTRLKEIRTIGAASLRSVELGETQAVLRFAAKPDTRERLEAILAAEARCCAFLELDLDVTPGAVVLTIATSEGGAPVMHQLVEAFRGRSWVAA